MSTLSTAGIACAIPDWPSHIGRTDSLLDGDELPARWCESERFTIADTGFGSGLNFLATVRKWLVSEPAGELHYIGIESAPWKSADIAQALASEPLLAPLLQQLLAQYPAPLRGWQRLRFPHWRVSLDLIFNDTRDAINDINLPIDAWYTHDTRVNTPLDTGLCSKTTGTIETAIVIGAGLAGSAAASALAKRGVTVTVLDKLPEPGCATSGNPVAALQGRYHKKQDHLGRWAQAATRLTLAELEVYSDTDIDRQRCGSIHMLGDTHEQSALAAQLQLPSSVGRWVSPDEASEQAGVKISQPALWQTEACVVNPAKLVTARLNSSPLIATLCGNTVTSLKHHNNQWLALDQDRAVLAVADIAILATGADTARWLPWLPLQLARGQLTAVPTPEKTPFTIIGYGGQLMPPKNGKLWLGATAARQPLSTEVLATEHSINIERLATALPELHRQLDCSSPIGRAAIRCKYLDHLPLAGELSNTDAPGLYLSAAHGARGVSNSTLCGEIIAGLACGNPPPRSLVEAAAPERAWQRHIKKPGNSVAKSPLDGTPIETSSEK